MLGAPGVLIIVLNNAAIGIATSLFLRSLNSILKTFASALELMFTAVLCWVCQMIQACNMKIIPGCIQFVLDQGPSGPRFARPFAHVAG